jgi:prepilin-type N-terminal cleavage/methylation domain-containing protein
MNKKNHKTQARSQSGFSLIELMIAMAVFLIVSGAAISLVRRHVPLFSAQQEQVGLNFSMRNAAAQLQIDVVNAGAGFTTGNIAVPMMGVLVTPPPTAAVCNTGQTYGAGCFDTLTILQVDQTAPPAHPIDNGTGCDSTTASTLFIAPADPSVTQAAESAAFHSGDFALVINTDTSGNITSLAPVALTKDSSVAGGKVKLDHNPQGSAGTNLGLAIKANNKLGIPACGTTSWVLKLQPPLTYFVDTTTNPADPRLMRQAGSAAPDIVAEQIIGFKVGVTTWNGTIDNRYLFLPTDTYDPATIRSVMVSLIGRTSGGGVDAVPNAVDQGLYKIEATSVVINPRNLSMGDSN